MLTAPPAPSPAKDRAFVRVDGLSLSKACQLSHTIYFDFDDRSSRKFISTVTFVETGSLK